MLTGCMQWSFCRPRVSSLSPVADSNRWRVPTTSAPPSSPPRPTSKPWPTALLTSTKTLWPATKTTTPSNPTTSRLRLLSLSQPDGDDHHVVVTSPTYQSPTPTPHHHRSLHVNKHARYCARVRQEVHNARLTCAVKRCCRIAHVGGWWIWVGVGTLFWFVLWLLM